MGKPPGTIGVKETAADAAKRGPTTRVVAPAKGTPSASTSGPTGVKDKAAVDAKATSDAKTKETKNAETELDLLRRLYGTVKNRSAKKNYYKYDRKKKKWIYETEAYIKDRSDFFGSTKGYETFRDACKKELDADKEKLRKYIEPQVKVRKKHTDWRDAQDVFYAWVKKAYNKKAGKKADFGKVIKAQMSDDLKKALDTVKKDYGKKFSAGGFNPRPQKMGGGYRLGTLSEHAVGNAIDIEAGRNAQIESWRWARIQKYTGKTASSSDLKTKWKNKDAAKAKGAWDSLKAVNDEWVDKLKKAVKKLEDEAAKKAAEAAKKAAEAAKKAGAGDKAKPAAAAKPAAKHDYLADVVAADENLKKIGKSWVTKWKDGFMSLEWTLVKELHEEGFDWGGTWSSPDIHHFEL